MAADKQYPDAKRALLIIQQDALAPGSFLTYGSLAQALGYEPATHARHIGQVCSLIDAACYWMKLPSLSVEKVRRDDNSYNPDAFSGDWAPVREQLIANSASRLWSPEDIARLVRALDTHMNGESALLQWKKISSFGQAAVERAVSYK